MNQSYIAQSPIWHATLVMQYPTTLLLTEIHQIKREIIEEKVQV
jgi:hypothetical protein